MSGRISRRWAVFGSLAMALALATQPVAAATVTKTTGYVGHYVFNDDLTTTRGADCVYEDHTELHRGVTGYWLDTLSIRGPRVYARHNSAGTKQWVGWRYKVQTQPSSDGTAPWTTIYTSSVAKAKASISSGYQFPRRTWYAPKSLPDVNVRVFVLVYWYKRGGSTTVQGTVRASYDYYHVKGGGPHTIRQTDCYRVN
jgi:hypothetical protein